MVFGMINEVVVGLKDTEDAVLHGTIVNLNPEESVPVLAEVDLVCGLQPGILGASSIGTKDVPAVVVVAKAVNEDS